MDAFEPRVSIFAFFARIRRGVALTNGGTRDALLVPGHRASYRAGVMCTPQLSANKHACAHVGSAQLLAYVKPKTNM